MAFLFCYTMMGWRSRQGAIVSTAMNRGETAISEWLFVCCRDFILFSLEVGSFAWRGHATHAIRVCPVCPGALSTFDSRKLLTFFVRCHLAPPARIDKEDVYVTTRLSRWNQYLPQFEIFSVYHIIIILPDTYDHGHENEWFVSDRPLEYLPTN